MSERKSGVPLNPGVYKLKHAGQIYYRLGLSPLNARLWLARELLVTTDKIAIMDGGKKQ